MGADGAVMLSGRFELTAASGATPIVAGAMSSHAGNRRLGTRAGALVLLCAAAAMSGCGSGGESGAVSEAGPAAIAAANKVNLADFPQTDGKKTFAQIQKEANAQQDANLLPAANDFVEGRENRLPFGLFDVDRAPIWGPTVMYFSAGTNEPATGPIVVKAHDLQVPEEFRSKTSESDYGTIGNGFYAATFKAPALKKLNVLTLTNASGGMQAAATGLVLVKDDPAPAPGEKVPAVDTPTLESVGGDASKIDTRVPPDTMHDISLKDALPLAKKQNKPIVLIFATPALCASRVCGPVVDVASEVQAKEGGNVIWIHNEIYKENDVNKGYLPQVKRFGLTSEPFTFVISPQGKVVAQLQGPFVASELEAAIQKAK